MLFGWWQTAHSRFCCTVFVAICSLLTEQFRLFPFGLHWMVLPRTPLCSSGEHVHAFLLGICLAVEVPGCRSAEIQLGRHCQMVFQRNGTTIMHSSNAHQFQVDTC